MSAALERLIFARAIIENIDHWCQGNSARNAAGSPTNPEFADACQFCAVGACIAARAPVTPLQAVVPDGFGSVQELNDRCSPATSHRRVLEVFDAAIAKLL